jgi:hypothetical protein
MNMLLEEVVFRNGSAVIAVVSSQSLLKQIG